MAEQQKRGRVPFSMMRTAGGYLNGEVRSALQKDIRRGNEREALFWATELAFSGYANYVWKTLRMIASEDIGLGCPQTVILTRCLYENWVEQKKADQGREAGANEFLVHAVLALARAPKSRMVDHAHVVMLENREAIPIPDYALDNHTAAGRRMGRDNAFFYEHSAVVSPEAPIRDPWKEEAIGLDILAEMAKKPKPPVDDDQPTLLDEQ